MINEGFGVRSLFLVFFHLSGAVRDEADGGAVQSREVSHLFEPILNSGAHTASPQRAAWNEICVHRVTRRACGLSPFN